MNDDYLDSIDPAEREVLEYLYEATFGFLDKPVGDVSIDPTAVAMTEEFQVFINVMVQYAQHVIVIFMEQMRKHDPLAAAMMFAHPETIFSKYFMIGYLMGQEKFFEEVMHVCEKNGIELSALLEAPEDRND